MTIRFPFGVLALTWLVTSGENVTEHKPAPSEHTNRLAHEKSPYLLQHAHNPVDWYPWGEEAFAKARRENKPIFLSVGYSTCHWCHAQKLLVARLTEFHLKHQTTGGLDFALLKFLDRFARYAVAKHG